MTDNYKPHKLHLCKQTNINFIAFIQLDKAHIGEVDLQQISVCNWQMFEPGHIATVACHIVNSLKQAYNISAQSLTCNLCLIPLLMRWTASRKKQGWECM